MKCTGADTRTGWLAVRGPKKGLTYLGVLMNTSGESMSVKLNIDSQFFGRDKDASRDVRIEVNGSTVGECLGQYFSTKPDIIRDFFDKSGQLEKTTYLFINKTPVFTGQLEREVKEGDELTFLYAPLFRC